MAVDANFVAAMQKVDDATNAQAGALATISAAAEDCANRVKAIAATLSTRMTDAEVSAAVAGLTSDSEKMAAISDGLAAVSTTLNGIGADPANPVPAKR